MSMFRAFRRRPKSCRPYTLLQQLEERIVLDAAVNPAVQDNHDNHTEPVNDTGANDATTKAVATPDSAPAGATGTEPPPLPTKYDHVFSQDLNVVLISNALTDVQGISDAAAKDAQVIVYDAAQDNLATIEQKLDAVVETAGQKINHLAILSHGDAGLLKLTPTSLFTATSVQSNPAAWHTLGTLLAENARIDIYACSLGQGPAGIAFVQSLAQATGAAVWASDDMTGSIAGADWDLEVKSEASSMGSLIDPASVHAAGLYLSSAPIVDSQSVSVNEDGTLTITVTGSDTDDPDVSKVTFEVTSPVTHGTLAAVGTAVRTEAGHYSQQFLYTPTPDYNGSDSFQFAMKTPKDPVWNGFAAGTAIGADSDDTFCVALGDVNRDGNLDVIAGNYYQTNKVYLGNASGGFNYYGTVGTDTDYHRSLALGDVNGDGKLDLVANNANQINKVYLGDGSGGFTLHGDAGADTDFTTSIALGDLNGDGNLDLVDGNNGTSEVFLGNGSGGFNYHGTVGTAATISIALGDVDRDGNLDLVAGNNGTNKLYLGDGSGGLNYYGTVGTDTDFTFSVALGDVNGDGNLDVVAGNDGQTNKVYLGNGSGGFSAGTDISGDINNTRSVALGDVNGDGKLDVVVGNYGQTNKVYLGNGSGGFSAGTAIGGDTDNTYSVVLGDVNRDGNLDVIAGNLGQTNKVYLNNGLDYGGATFAFSAAANVGTDTDNTKSIASGDVNNDGRLDVIAGSEGQTTKVYLQNASGGFSAGTSISSDTDTTESIALGDVNRDGKLDVITGNAGQTNKVYLGDGSGGFSAGTAISADTDITMAIALGDVDGDGKLDVITGNAGQTNKVYLQNESGGFAAGTAISADTDITYDIALGDVNSDGKLDVIAGNWGLNKVYLGNGSGGFSAGTNISGDTDNTCSIALGDVNGDGKLDAIAGDESGDNKVYLGDGSGGFAAATDLSTETGNTMSIAIRDVNRDGKLDVIAGTSNAGNKIYLGDGSGSFTYYDTVGIDDHTYSVALADVNGDGTLDVIAGDYGQTNKVYQSYYNEASALGTVNITVTAENDAPTLGSSTVSLTGINEDAVSNSGQHVSAFVGGYGDVDTGDAHGIGVTGTTGNGHWEWSANGTDWNTISGVSGTNALLLDAYDFVRYVPDTHNGETATLVYKAWDHTEGTLHGTFDPTGHTGTTHAFSTTDQTASILVTDVNDLPTAVSQSVSVNEDGTLTITVTGIDGDDPDVSKVTFEVTSPVTHGTLSAVGAAVQTEAGHYSQQFMYTPTPDYNGSDSFQFTMKTPKDPVWNGFGTGATVGADANFTNAVAVGDVNCDGKLDVVIGNWEQTSKVYLGDGSGGFSAGTAISSDTDHTLSIALGDVNADGKLDVVVGNYGETNKVYLGDGSGGFAAGADIDAVSYHTMSVAMGDVNGDGKLDVIAGNYGETNKVYLGDGSGGFAPGTDISADTDNTRSVALGDVNGDGKLDVIAGNAWQTSKVYLGNGSGGFGAGTAFGVDTDCTMSIALADVNGDGKLDVIAGNNGLDKVYLGDGSGSFTAGTAIGGADGDGTYSIALGDVNSDGKLDVIVGNWGLNKVYVGNGSGGFAADTDIGVSPNFTSSVALGDVNGDGKLDVIAGNNGQTSKVYLNNGLDYGGLTFAFSAAADVGTDADQTYSIALGDVNRDGILDVIAGNNEQTSKVYVGIVGGSFTYYGTVGTDTNDTQSIALGDVNGDGKLDVISGNWGQTNKVYLGNGSGGFSAGTDIGMDTDRTYSVALGDVNGDGKLDVIAGNYWQASKVYLGNGSGGFTLYGTIGTETDYTYSVALGDVNGDGNLDAIAGDIWQTNKVYLGNGSGGFTLYGTVGTETDYTQSVALGDVNGDGNLDVIAGNYYQTNKVYLGNGSGGFTLYGTVGTEIATASVALGDVNGDGKLDVIAGNYMQGSKVYLGDGSGGFTLYRTVGTATDQTMGVALGDVNGDGNLDVVAGNNGYANKVYLGCFQEASAPGTVGVTINAENDAPTLSSPTVTLTSITEDQVSNSGQQVSVFVGGYGDVDTGDAHGIGVTAATGNGHWEWSANGTDWNIISAVTSTNALLLDANDYVRYVPDAHNGETAHLVYKAWDHTEGTLHGTFDPTGHTGTTYAFSTTDQTASIVVTAVNDAPVLSLSTGAGALDPTFSADGKVTTDFRANDDSGYAVAIQPDGKIVVAGQAYNGSDYDFAVERYNSDGSLDTTFDPIDHDGRVTTPIGSSNDYVYSVAIQSDGKIVVAGCASSGSNSNFAVARYNSDGSLDTTGFGIGGKLMTDIDSSNDYAYSVAIQSDGKIVVAGQARVGSDYDFALVRYNADGNLDTSFDGDGKVRTDIADYPNGAYSVAIQSNGKIVAAGYASNGSDTDFALVRYNSDGSLDTTGFGTGGKVTTPIGGSGDGARSVAIQSNGKIVAAGYASNGSNTDFALVRYNSDGSLDTTGFGAGGKVTTPIGSSQNIAESVAIQPDGKIVAAGYASSGSDPDVALVRYNSDGSLDTTGFGTNGKVTTDFGNSNDFANSVAIQPDGKIVAAGTASNWPDHDFALVRYNASALAYTENDEPQVIDGAITVTDVDSTNMASATVRISDHYVSGEDVLAFTAISNITGTWHADTGVLNLTGTDTVANYEAALRSVTYENTSDAPHTDARTVSWTVNDGLADSTPQATTITVTVVNDAPVAVDDGVYTVSEHGSVAVVAANGVLANDTDVDTSHNSLTAHLVTGPAKGSLAFNIDGSFTYNPNGQFEYLAVGDHEDVTFTYKTIDDQSAESNVATVTITVTGLNDAPAGTDKTVTMSEDGTYIVQAADFGFTDPVDTSPNTFIAVKITEVPTAGNLNLDGVPVSPDQVITVADIEAGKLTFAPSHDGNGAAYANFKFAVIDDGGTLSGGVDTDPTPNTMTFDVGGVNDAPTINGPIAAQEVDPSGAVTFSTANGNLISISDVDAGTGLLKVTLTATHGTMTLNGAFLTGLSFDPALGGQGDGTSDATMTFLGTQTDINNALNGMKFTHDAGFSGMADVTINVNDQGNTGTGGALSSAPGVTNISVEPFDTWFHGFGTESGWEVYNHADTNISYYTHDYTVLWQHVTSTNTWNFFNGTDWVGTNDLGNAPYADGYGPFATWFPDNVTGGTYNGYEVYIHANGVTEFSLDHTAPGATYWQVTGAGAWTYFDGSAWYPTAGFNVGPDNVWYHGFGIGAGWNVYSDAGTNISYYSHDYTVLWQHVTSTNTWNFFNGTDWVGTNDLGNAPYADGYGPFGQWFPDNVTGGTYNGYEVYIHANGVTEFSLDHTAPGAQYWQVTGAGAWTYYDGSAWYSTAGFNVGPDNVWYHGFGTDAGWNVYNHSATSISYYTHDYVSLWQHVTSTNTWNFFDGSAWYATTGLNVGPVDVWYHGFGTYAGWEVYDDAATIISYYTHTYVTLWQHVTATDAWNYFDGTVWTPTTGLGVIV